MREDRARDMCLRTLNLCPTAYNTLFFSAANVHCLQAALRTRIRDKTGYVIDRQNPDDLLVIMRAMYVNYGREPPCDRPDVVAAHVGALNSVVVKVALPQIASGVVAHLNYLRDASSLPVPPPDPQMTTVAGTKNLPIFPGI